MVRRYYTRRRWDMERGGWGDGERRRWGDGVKETSILSGGGTR